ncbi:MAG: SCO family protein [Ignavibacteriaceae bacterium]|nr:SCO family protein [Ignavibacteriaceae bacterium]
MKNKMIILIPVVIFILAAIFYVNFTKESYSKNKGRQDTETGNSAGMGETNDLCCINNNSHSTGYSENSIYQLKSIWKDQNNVQVKLDKFSGKRIILAMIYTSCTTACPVIVNNMQKLEAAVPKEDLPDYRFILVSIDPKRDTPAQLKEFAEEKNLNSSRWSLLTGPAEDIAELAQAIGFKYRQNSSGTFTHTNLITFINSKGEIISQSEGLNIGQKGLNTIFNK